MPLQHISDRMLRSMRRERSGAAVRKLIERIRGAVPGIALRTSLIVGYPGETEEDFAELLAFVRETRFDRLGVFEYSREENTDAYTLPDQVASATKKRRQREIMRAQAAVAAAVNGALVGSEREVLVCGEDGEGRLYGRLSTQAPDIDGIAHLEGDARPGEIVRARVVSADVYDLRCRTLGGGLIDTEVVRP